MRPGSPPSVPGWLAGALLALFPFAAGSMAAAEVDLRDAVKAGQVTVEARGYGNTENLTLTLSTGLPSIDIVIPAGTYFAWKCPGGPGAGGPQPMVVTHAARVHLAGRLTVTLEAGCADLNGEIPQPQDALSICDTPPALGEVVTCLTSHPEIAAWTQFVIWALTNDMCDFSPLHPSAADLDAIRQALQSCGIRTDGWCLFDASLFVPVVLSSSGASQSFFTTELTLTNRGGADATLTFAYVPAFGGGGGEGTDVLAAGRQRVVPDAIGYLQSLRIPLPATGNRGGTVRVSVAGASTGEIDVTARTTTAIANGRAGLAYPGMTHAGRLDGTSYLCGLRQNAQDRSNVALQNAGGPSDGDVTLRLTVFSGDAPYSHAVLPNVTLAPGAFQQISGILATNGLSLANGFVRIERVGGGARYLAYAVINDQATSDGSYVPAVTLEDATLQARLALPVVVETGTFSTELVATNFSPAPRILRLTFVADAIQTADHAALFTLALEPGEQKILPDFVAAMRQGGTPGLGPAGPTYTGALFVEDAGGDLSGVVVGARVSSPGAGGRFGLFFTAQALERQTASALWLYGLQQNAENRTNLALVSLGEPGDAPDAFDVEIYDGSTGARAGTLTRVSLEPRAWRQYGAILSTNAPGVTQGYARVVRTSGTSPFLVYGVLNDGAVPGQRTGDGAFIWGVP